MIGINFPGHPRGVAFNPTRCKFCPHMSGAGILKRIFVYQLFLLLSGLLEKKKSHMKSARHFFVSPLKDVTAASQGANSK